MAACADPTGTRAGGEQRSQLVIDLPAVPGDTLPGLGFEVSARFADGTPIRQLRIVVDSGTAGQREFVYGAGALTERGAVRALA